MNKPALRNIERLGNSAESMFNAYYWLCRQMQQQVAQVLGIDEFEVSVFVDNQAGNKVCITVENEHCKCVGMYLDKFLELAEKPNFTAQDFYKNTMT